MFKGWRISSWSGVLLATYFIPVWTLIAFSIMVSPIHGLYERPSVSVGLFISDHWNMSGMSTVRAAWLLALVRMTVVAFFAIFIAFLGVPTIRRKGGCDEVLGVALLLGSGFSLACLVMAARVGEAAALRVHAAELLMLLGTAIVMMFEAPRSSENQPEATAPELSLQQS